MVSGQGREKRLHVKGAGWRSRPAQGWARGCGSPTGLQDLPERGIPSGTLGARKGRCWRKDVAVPSAGAARNETQREVGFCVSRISSRKRQIRQTTRSVPATGMVPCGAMLCQEPQCVVQKAYCGPLKSGETHPVEGFDNGPSNPAADLELMGRATADLIAGRHKGVSASRGC